MSILERFHKKLCALLYNLAGYSEYADHIAWEEFYIGKYEFKFSSTCLSITNYRLWCSHIVLFPKVCFGIMSIMFKNSIVVCTGCFKILSRRGRAINFTFRRYKPKNLIIGYMLCLFILYFLIYWRCPCIYLFQSYIKQEKERIR